MNGEIIMKKLLIGLLSLGSIAAFANEPVVRCDIDYVNDSGNGMHITLFHNIGKMSVQDCMNKALKEKEKTLNEVEFKFSHFTKTSGPNADIGSEGWSLTSKIVDQAQKPSNLRYIEFFNP
jgi:hypothetical protein